MSERRDFAHTRRENGMLIGMCNRCSGNDSGGESEDAERDEALARDEVSAHPVVDWAASVVHARMALASRMSHTDFAVTQLGATQPRYARLTNEAARALVGSSAHDTGAGTPPATKARPLPKWMPLADELPLPKRMPPRPNPKSMVAMYASDAPTAKAVPKRPVTSVARAKPKSKAALSKAVPKGPPKAKSKAAMPKAVPTGPPKAKSKAAMPKAVPKAPFRVVKARTLACAFSQ